MGLPATKVETARKEKKSYIRKRWGLSATLQRIKLWPSRNGTLHGIKSIVTKGAYIEFVTHCGQKMRIRDSKTGRVARWLRNKWHVRSCPGCKMPAWKLEKYSLTSFK